MNAKAKKIPVGTRRAKLSPARDTPKANGHRRRGRSHRPNIAVSESLSESSHPAMKKSSRVVTCRIEPTKEQWILLLRRASEGASYANRHMQAKLGDSLGWRVPEAAQKDTLTKHVRTGEEREHIKARLISANVYCAAETEAKKDWTRGARKIMAGAKLPQYAGHSLGLATISDAPGVKILPDGDGGFLASLHITADKQELPTWEHVPIARRTYRDELVWPKLRAFADGELKITHARIIFKRSKGKTLLQLAYPVSYPVVPFGARVATLSLSEFELEGEKYARLQVRDGDQFLDLTGRLHTFLARKQSFDSARRRAALQIGRAKGAARAKRRFFAAHSLVDFAKTHWQQTASEVLKWTRARGCSSLRVLALSGGDWPAHEFTDYLKHGAEREGIAFGEVSPETPADPGTERAAKAEVRRARRRNRKLSDAALEIAYQNSMKRKDPENEDE